jgi:ADP-dependent NAD(P)H-hydrate dehydratase / NAD(P)H-hydrate epimerase
MKMTSNHLTGTKKNTHKGSFGHLSLVHGEKEGAAIISAMAALRYGSGLVTLVGEKISALPYALMQDGHLPQNTTAIACGMGLGKNFQRERLSKVLSHDLPLVLDADIFYHSIFYDLLHKEMIITPHPKEFVHILKMSNLADITVHDLQDNRFKYVELFSKQYPQIVLVLKGANTIIAHHNSFYINPLGTPALAKGGSGDILTGLCGALLAQGYSSLEAAIQASLAQTLSARSLHKNSYALTPEDIIEGLVCL